MGELIVLENVRYKIYKNKNNGNVSKIEESGIPFVSCGIETGAILGKVIKIGNMPSNSYLEAVNSGLLVRPLVLFCQTNLQAKTMFKNIEEDDTRFNKLAGEIQKQKIINSSKNQFSVVETITQTNTQNMEKGKRLALNNGWFKANDNYTN